MKRLPIHTLVVGFIWALVVVAPAYAKPLPIRKTGLNRFSEKLHVDVGLQDLFATAQRERLRSGFATRVFIRVSVFPDGVDRPIANSFRRSEIIYDIWEERYRIHREEGSALNGVIRDERFSVSSEADAIRLATALVKFPVADLTALRPGQRFQIAFRADLNPLSQEMAENVQRSLTRPNQNQEDLPGESLFGSFVAIFVSPRTDDSDRELRFVSQTFWEPRR